MVFSPERIENLKQLGYLDAMRVLEQAGDGLFAPAGE